VFCLKEWNGPFSLRAWTKSIDDVLRLGSTDQASFAEHPLPLAILLAEDVASIRASFGRQPGGCDLEALLESLVCLLLWHRSTILLIEVCVHFCPDEGDGGVSRASPEADIQRRFPANWWESGGSIDIISSLIPATHSNVSDLLAKVCAGLPMIPAGRQRW
jgi:hypothetical protein